MNCVKYEKHTSMSRLPLRGATWSLLNFKIAHLNPILEADIS